MQAEKDFGINISGIDIKGAILRFGGKKDKYLKSLAKFANELPDKLEPFDEAILPQNIDNTNLFIHTLKGSFR